MLNIALGGQRKARGYRYRLPLTSDTLRQFILPFTLLCPCNKMLTLSTVTLTISSSKAAASAHNPILRTFSGRWCCKIHCNIDSRSFYNRRRDISRRDGNYIRYIKNNACSLHIRKKSKHLHLQQLLPLLLNVFPQYSTNGWSSSEIYLWHCWGKNVLWLLRTLGESTQVH